MAGGVGTGFWLKARCGVCSLAYQEEIYFKDEPTEEDIQEAKERAEEYHLLEKDCEFNTVFGILNYSGLPNDSLPPSALALLIK